MWELELVHGDTGSRRFWCANPEAAMKRARDYLDRVGGVTEIHIRLTLKETHDDRKGA